MKFKWLFCLLILSLLPFNSSFSSESSSFLSENPIRDNTFDFYSEPQSSVHNTRSSLSTDNSVLITENNSMEQTLPVNESLTFQSDVTTNWSIIPSLHDLYYQSLGENGDIFSWEITSSDYCYFVTTGHIGVYDSFCVYGNGSNMALAKFSNILLPDSNIPNLYLYPTVMSADFIIEGVNNYYYTSPHQITLTFRFGANDPQNDIIFLLDYNPSFPPDNEVAPNIYCTSAPYPNQLLIAENSDNNTSWIHFEHNITALLHEYFPISGYPSAASVFTNLTEVSIDVVVLSLEGDFSVLFGLDNLTVRSTIPKESASLFIPSTPFTISSSVLNFSLSIPEHFFGNVSYLIQSVMQYYILASIIQPELQIYLATVPIFNNFSAFRGSRCVIKLVYPESWVIKQDSIPGDWVIKSIIYYSSWSEILVNATVNFTTLQFTVIIEPDLFIGQLDYLPLHVYEHTVIKVNITDSNGYSVNDAIVNLECGTTLYSMIYSEPIDQYMCEIPALLLMPGSHVLSVNASRGFSYTEKSFSVMVYNTDVFINIDAFPSMVDVNNNFTISTSCYKNNSLNGLSLLKYGSISLYINNTLDSSQIITDGSNDFLVHGFSTDVKLVIFQLILSIESSILDSKIITVQINQPVNITYQTPVVKYQSIVPQNINSTTRMFFEINYQNSGNLWRINFLDLDLRPEYCFIERGNLLVLAEISSQYIEWNLIASASDVDRLIIEVETPVLTIERDIIDNVAILNLKVTSPTHFPQFYIALPLTLREDMVCGWTIYDINGNNITDDFSIVKNPGSLLISNLSMTSAGVIFLQLTGLSPAFAILLSTHLPLIPMYYNTISLKYEIEALIEFTGVVRYQLGSMGYSNTVFLYLSKSASRYTATTELGPFKWNSSVLIETFFYDSIGRILYYENFTCTIADDLAPIVHPDVLIKGNYAHLSLSANEPSLAAGIFKLEFSNNTGNYELFPVFQNNTHYNYFLNLTIKSWNNSFQFTVIDRAGNSIRIIQQDFDVTTESTLASQESSSKTDNLIPIAMAIVGMLGLLVLVIIKRSDQIIEL